MIRTNLKKFVGKYGVPKFRLEIKTSDLGNLCLHPKNSLIPLGKRFQLIDCINHINSFPKKWMFTENNKLFNIDKRFWFQGFYQELWQKHGFLFTQKAYLHYPTTLEECSAQLIENYPITNNNNGGGNVLYRANLIEWKLEPEEVKERAYIELDGRNFVARPIRDEIH